jgi:hypothetical protein
MKKDIPPIKAEERVSMMASVIPREGEITTPSAMNDLVLIAPLPAFVPEEYAMRKIKVSKQAFEAMTAYAQPSDNWDHTVEVVWGVPDEEGFYTPAVFVTSSPKPNTIIFSGSPIVGILLIAMLVTVGFLIGLWL